MDNGYQYNPHNVLDISIIYITGNTSIIDFNTIYTRYNIQVFISLLKRLMKYLCKVDFLKTA